MIYRHTRRPPLGHYKDLLQTAENKDKYLVLFNFIPIIAKQGCMEKVFGPFDSHDEADGFVKSVLEVSAAGLGIEFKGIEGVFVLKIEKEYISEMVENMRHETFVCEQEDCDICGEDDDE